MHQDRTGARRCRCWNALLTRGFAFLAVFALLPAPMGFSQSTKGEPPAAVSPVPKNLPGNAYVKVRVMSEETTLPAGGTGYIAIQVKVVDGWHVYWRNNGDSGAPVVVDWRVPEGVTIGECQWPVPKRYAQPGDILDYIFEGSVILIFPVTVSADIAPGTEITIGGYVQWLVCSDVCVPGAAEIRFPIGIRSASESGKQTPFAKVFAEERGQHPIPMTDPAAKIVSATWDELALVIRCEGAKSMTFFPYEAFVTPQPKEILKSGHVEGAEMKIPYDEKALGAAHVVGVVEITKSDGSIVRVLIDVPGPEKAVTE